MKYCAATLSNLAAEIAVAHVTAHHFKRRMADAVEPAPVVERVVLGECAHAIALGEKCFREVRTYESVCTRYEYDFILVNHISESCGGRK